MLLLLNHFLNFLYCKHHSIHVHILVIVYEDMLDSFQGMLFVRYNLLLVMVLLRLIL